jgi:hypothetical protein
MKKFLRLLACLVLGAVLAVAQTATTNRNSNLYPDASSSGNPIAKLAKGTTVQLLEPAETNGYYHVQTADNQSGYVYGRNLHVQPDSGTPPVSTPGTPSNGTQTPTSTPVTTNAPVPLLAKGHPVDWWFVFKMNSGIFPGCGTNAVRACIFGGQPQNWSHFGQQFVFASSESPTLVQGSNCVGDTTDDPVGATFDEVYNGSFFFVLWNDQFYQDPKIPGCSGDSCSSPWGHSKGMVAWNDAGEGFVMQVSTPDWPGAGSQAHPRTHGNTLGCTKDDDVEVSQHFFALRLTKDDLLQVLTALQNASVVTDPVNPQIVKNGGPAEVQSLVAQLGKQSTNNTVIKAALSTGVELISKPSRLHVPPWQMVSSILDAVPLRAATWWMQPAIPDTTADTKIDCWDSSLGQPGGVTIAKSGQWDSKTFDLTGGNRPNANHAKIGVSLSSDHHFAIFGDMNQQGAISGNCGSSQNGRGGLFYAIENQQLSDSVQNLITGTTPN